MADNARAKSSGEAGADRELITAFDVQGLWRLLVQLGQAALFLGEARETALIISGGERAATARVLYDATMGLMREASAALNRMGSSAGATPEAQAFFAAIRDALRPEWAQQTAPDDDREQP